MITKKERPEMLISIQSGEGKNGKPYKKFMRATVYEYADGSCIFDTHHTSHTFEKWEFVFIPGCLITCGNNSYVLYNFQDWGRAVILFTYQIKTNSRDVRELINHSYRYSR